ncbi:MAG: hypothetical protein QW057_07015 [Candidatus Bathyarchaeia archaeon]
MTIEIDDAGWGDLVGGCFIVVRRVETGQYYAGEVPVRLFQEPAFKEKQYLEEAWRIVSEGLKAMSVSLTEPIRVCTGYVLSQVRRNLAEEGYTVIPTRIVGETQDLAERLYVDSLRQLGIAELNVNAGGGRFRPLLEWVQKDIDGRERYVKTGWKSWRTKWREAAQASSALLPRRQAGFLDNEK